MTSLRSIRVWIFTFFEPDGNGRPKKKRNKSMVREKRWLQMLWNARRDKQDIVKADDGV